MNFPYCLLCGEGLGGQTIATTLGTFHAICYNDSKRGAKNWMEEDEMIKVAIEERKATKEELSNATTERQEPKNNQSEHSGVGQVGAATKASSGDSHVNGKKGRKKKVAESIAA